MLVNNVENENYYSLVFQGKDFLKTFDIILLLLFYYVTNNS